MWIQGPYNTRRASISKALVFGKGSLRCRYADISEVTGGLSIRLVNAAIATSPGKSLRRLSRRLHVALAICQQIVRNNRKRFHAIYQALHERNCEERATFSALMCQKMTEEETFSPLQRRQFYMYIYVAESTRTTRLCGVRKTYALCTAWSVRHPKLPFSVG
jgi:hypothetical protein